MIEIKNYSKTFEFNNLLHDTSLSIPDDSLIGLIGPSGSGKTTLLRNISLLDKEYDGHIIVDGIDLNSLKEKEKEKFRIEKFCYVFSDANLLEYLSVKENACFSRILLGEPIDYRRLDELIVYLGLDKIINSKVKDLSAGEKQRISILRALISDRKYMICDEPTAHIDPENAEKTINLFQDIAHDMHKTVLVSLHDMEYLHMFDSIYKINNKRLEEYVEA